MIPQLEIVFRWQTIVFSLDKYHASILDPSNSSGGKTGKMARKTRHQTPEYGENQARKAPFLEPGVNKHSKKLLAPALKLDEVKGEMNVRSPSNSSFLSDPRSCCSNCVLQLLLFLLGSPYTYSHSLCIFLQPLAKWNLFFFFLSRRFGPEPRVFKIYSGNHSTRTRLLLRRKTSFHY